MLLDRSHPTAKLVYEFVLNKIPSLMCGQYSCAQYINRDTEAITHNYGAFFLSKGITFTYDYDKIFVWKDNSTMGVTLEIELSEEDAAALDKAIALKIEEDKQELELSAQRKIEEMKKIKADLLSSLLTEVTEVLSKDGRWLV